MRSQSQDLPGVLKHRNENRAKEKLCLGIRKPNSKNILLFYFSIVCCHEFFFEVPENEFR
jgi:hypothetical protein